MSIKLRWVVLLLTGILTVSMGITAFTYTDTGAEADFSVTAATYPLYTAALNVVGDTAGVSVSCLIQPSAGCAHEYQLSPAEMRALSVSDVIVRGGGDAFLDGALASLPEIIQIHTVTDADLLPSCAEEHSHEQDGHHHEHNEHSWVDPVRYKRQVEALRDGLCAADPKNGAAYTRNAAAYLEKIDALAARFTAAPIADGAILFHDSVAYAAEFLGLSTLAVLPLGEDAGVSAADLARAAEAVRDKTVVLLYDAQFAEQEFAFDTYAAKTVTVIWDTAVLPRRGVADADAWLHAMEENLKRWEAAV